MWTLLLHRFLHQSVTRFEAEVGERFLPAQVSECRVPLHVFRSVPTIPLPLAVVTQLVGIT
jgi:hypothetical protein